MFWISKNIELQEIFHRHPFKGAYLYYGITKVSIRTEKDRGAKQLEHLKI